MIFVSHYDSPLGMIYMAADDDVLKGVWFEGQKYFASGLDKTETEDKETPVLKQTKEWLDLYFAGTSSFSPDGIRIGISFSEFLLIEPNTVPSPLKTSNCFLRENIVYSTND